MNEPIRSAHEPGRMGARRLLRMWWGAREERSAREGALHHDVEPQDRQQRKEHEALLRLRSLMGQ